MRNLIFMLHLLRIIPPACHPVPPSVAAPGSDVTLGCFFPHTEADSPLNLIVGWQRGDNEVVHSYYKAADSLETQSPAYRGRTQLYPDQLAVGNASLRLTGVRASDHGEFTCTVANEQGRFQVKIFLAVAAPYEEPQLAILTTCESIILTFLSSLGFPQPNVLWRSQTGSDITNQSNTTLDLKDGVHYEVLSTMVLKPSDLQTVTFELRLDLLNQRFSHSITLHPLPECCAMHVQPRNRLPFLAWFVPLMILACSAVGVLIYKKQPPSHDPGITDVPVGAEQEEEEEEEEEEENL